MKNNVYPCEPKFYYIKVGFKGSKLYMYIFVMNTTLKGEKIKSLFLLEAHSFL